MTAAFWTHGPLPSRVAIASDEALDCYLERLAAANGLATTQLMRLLTRPGERPAPSSAFLMFKPDPAITDRIAELGGMQKPSLEKATLMRYGDGLPLRLDGLDPRRRHSFRQVVTQGWFPQFGSQACPLCLTSDGIWRLEWRLPIVAVCVQHALFLTTRCAGCGMRFRTHRHLPLRPQLGPQQPCGNPISLRNPCQHHVIAHSVEAATEPVVAAATAIKRVLTGQPVRMLGRQTDPQIYLAELRHLSTLLLHLLSRQGTTSVVDWADDIHVEALNRTTQRRGPRWGISPPQSALLRGQVLSESHGILTETGVEEAATRLAPWLSLIADVGNGPRGWLLNRTTRTATMERLVDAAVSNRHHVGRRLDRMRSEPTLRTTAIPQLIDVDIYREYFGEMLGGYEWTGRLYVSLCMVRTVTPTANWSGAAAPLGLDPPIGIRTARAAATRMRVSPTTFADAVERAGRALPRDRNFRHRESRVRALAQESSIWYESWRTSMSPTRRYSSFPSAVAWMWCEVAQGSLDTSPPWGGRPTRASKVAYRAFRDKLPLSAQESLRLLVLTG
jgi:TniQ protein